MIRISLSLPIPLLCGLSLITMIASVSAQAPDTIDPFADDPASYWTRPQRSSVETLPRTYDGQIDPVGRRVTIPPANPFFNPQRSPVENSSPARTGSPVNSTTEPLAPDTSGDAPQPYERNLLSEEEQQLRTHQLMVQKARMEAAARRARIAARKRGWSPNTRPITFGHSFNTRKHPGWPVE